MRARNRWLVAALPLLTAWALLLPTTPASAAQSLPGGGAPLWGQGRPWGAPEEAWSEEAERRRRHERLLARWPPEAGSGAGRQRRGAM